MPLSAPTEHNIRQGALSIELNYFSDPDFIRVTLLAGAVILAYKKGVISFNAAYNYRRWTLKAENTHFESSAAVNVYARLDRSEENPEALIIYDQEERNIEGGIITSESEGAPDEKYYYIFLGRISASIDESGNTVEREWEEPFRYGYLDTNEGFTEYVSDFVTISTEQVVTGVKDFGNGFKIGGIVFKKDENGNIFIDGNILLSGSLTMYAQGDSPTPPSIFDALPIDGITIGWVDGKLSVIGGGTGGSTTLGGLTNVGSWADVAAPEDRVLFQAKDSTQWSSKLLSELVGSSISGIKVNNETYAPDTDGYITIPDYPTSLDWDEIDNKPSWIGSTKPSYAWSEITDKPSWIGDSKPSYAFSEITGKPTTLAGYGITDAYSRTDADNRYVKKAGDTMTGSLKFTGGADSRTVELSNSGSLILTGANAGWASGLYYKLYGGTAIGYAAAAYGTANALSYYYYGGSYTNPSMVILPNGNVGIGTTSPTSKLHVAGDMVLNGIPIKKHASGVLEIDGDLIVTGSVTMYAQGSYTASTILDALPIDDTTLSKAGGKLSVIGGGGSGINGIYVGSTLYTPDADKYITLGNYYNAEVIRTANTVLAAPNGSNGSATFRKLVVADLPGTVLAGKGFYGTDFTTTVPATSDLIADNRISGSWNAGNANGYGNLVQFYTGGGGSTNYLQLWCTYGMSGLMWRASTEYTLNKAWRTLLDSNNYTTYVTKLGTSNVGSTTKPIYLSAGTPTACSYAFGNEKDNAAINNGTLNASLNADLLDGLHGASYRPVAHLGGIVDYGRAVIGLCPLTNTDTQALYYSFGDIYLLRVNGLFASCSVRYNVNKVYNSTSAAFSLLQQGNNFCSRCTFTYNGVKYAGLLVNPGAAQVGAIYAASFYSGCKPFLVYYYNTSSGVINAEVNSSIVVGGSDIQLKDTYGSFSGTFTGKLGTSTIGATTNPVYLKEGALTACSYTFGNASGNAAVNNGTLNTNLNADMIDGVHFQNMLERSYSGTSRTNGATGWFRIGVTKLLDANSISFMLTISRGYSYSDNQAYTFSINIVYGGYCSVNQISGATNAVQLDKIRITGTNSGSYYVDVHINTVADNIFYWTSIGQFRSYTAWEADATALTNSKEFTVSEYSAAMFCSSRNDKNLLTHTEAPYLDAGHTVGYTMGVGSGSYNSAYIGFRYKAKGSATNIVGIGIQGIGYPFNILGNGNVGIGTDSPTEKLTVIGNIGSTYYLLNNSATNPYLRLAFNGVNWYAQAYRTSGKDYMYLGAGTANSLRIDSTGNVLTPGGVTMYSDIRKKDVLEDIMLPLERIAEAPLFSYTYKGDKSRTQHIGTSAQYWQDVPGIVRTDGEDGYLTMDYNSLLSASVFSLAKYTMRHETEIERLKRENEEMRQRIKELERRAA